MRWALLLALAMVIGAAAAVEPAPSPAALACRQRQDLVIAARAGGIEAAARMIELGMFAELAEVDPRGPAFAPWMSRAEPVHAFTAQQVYGVVLANWAARNRSLLRGLYPGTLVRARAFIIGQPARHPLVALEAAWHWHDFAPADERQARASFDQALAMPPIEGDPEQALGIALDAALVATRNGYADRAAELRARARKLAEALGDDFFIGELECIEGLALGGGTPSERGAAKADYERAAERFARAGYPYRRGLCLMLLAAARSPKNDPSGTWAEVVRDYGAAARAFAQAGDPLRQADALSKQAGCLRPDENPRGSWDAAATLYRAAAAVLAGTVDAAGRADAAAAAARCAAQNDPLRMSAAARPLFREAAGLCRAAKLDEQADELESWLDTAAPDGM